MRSEKEFDELFLLAAKHIRDLQDEIVRLRAEVEHLPSASRRAFAKQGSNAKNAADPTQAVRWRILDRWLAWTRDSKAYASQDQFARSMREDPQVTPRSPNGLPIVTMKTIEAWCRDWKKLHPLQFNRKERKWTAK